VRACGQFDRLRADPDLDGARDVLIDSHGAGEDPFLARLLKKVQMQGGARRAE
jgi:hypothetical protein